jgi:hypothetical protein
MGPIVIMRPNTRLLQVSALSIALALLSGCGSNSAPATGSFSLSPSASSLNVVLGASGTDTITVTDASPFDGSVTLQASGLPAGVTASFSASPATVVTLSASATAALGASTVTITGTSGSLTSSTEISLTVSATAPLPCDIYATGATPCVAAHSTTRALFANYNGNLYGVQRASDATTLTIGLLSTGGYANAPAQDAFCADTFCTITTIYDQTANHNDLTVEAAGGNGPADHASAADALPVIAGGLPVYGLSISAQMGYRNDTTKLVPTGASPQGLYMVTSGTHYNNACCFDYGNAEVSIDDTGNGHMTSVYFGTACSFLCHGSGPWVEADLENGLFMSSSGGSQNTGDTGDPSPFVTAILKNNGLSQFALRQGNAQSGDLTTEYSGGEPTTAPGYSPMQLEGAIVLGTGGDNSNGSVGSFFEGVVTAGYPADDVEDSVQSNIVSVQYGASTGISGSLTPGSEISLQATTPGSTTDYISAPNNGTTQAVAFPSITSSSAAQALGDSTFIIRSGFADNTCVSFESRDQPGNFFRHSNYHLYSEPYDGTMLNAEDATFCPVTGNSGSGYSFHSFNFPTFYIRNYQGVGYIASDGGADAWDTPTNWSTDTTFTVATPWAP